MYTQASTVFIIIHLTWSVLVLETETLSQELAEGTHCQIFVLNKQYKQQKEKNP